MRTNIHRKVAVASLGLSLAFMPFSVPLCHLGVIAFGINWILEGHWKQKSELLLASPIVWLLPGFLVLHAIGLAYSENMATGWAVLEKKAFLFIVPLTVASSPQFSRRETDQLFAVFLASCLIATIVCLGTSISHASNLADIQSFGSNALRAYKTLNPGSSPLWLYFSYIDLSSGVHLHPTYLGFYLLVCLLLLASFLARPGLPRYMRLLMTLTALYFVVFIVLLNSRIILLGTLVVAFISGFLWIRRTPKLSTIGLSLTAFVFLMSLFLVSPVSRFRGFQEFFSGGNHLPFIWAENSWDVRRSLWSLSNQTIHEINLVTGVGTGDVEDQMRLAGDRYEVHNVLNTNDPHNQFLHTLIALGIPGLLLLLACFVAPIVAAYRAKFYLLGAFVLLFMLVCLTESALELQKGIICFSVLGSILLYHGATGWLSVKQVEYV